MVAAAAAATALTTACAAGPVGPPRVATAVAAASGGGAAPTTMEGGLPAGWAATPSAAAAAAAPPPYPPAGAVADGAGGWVLVPGGAAVAAGADKLPPPALPALPLAGAATTAAPAIAAAGTPPPNAAASPTAPPPPVPVVAAAPPPGGALPVFPADVSVAVTKAPLPPPPAVAPAGTFSPPPTAAPSSLPVLPAGGAFIPPPRCPSFPPFNLYTSGGVTLTISEVLGPLACGGNANLTGFSINYNSTCDPTSGALALAVGGVLTASSGQIVNGGISVGAPLPQTVGQVCTRPVAAGGVDFPRLTAAAVAASAALCDGPAPTRCVTRTDDGGGVVFDVSAAPPASLAVCTVPGRVLTAATGVTVAGRSSAATIVAINVVGGDPAAAAVRLVGCEFFGFTPATTVLNFCDVARLTVDNVGVPAAVLAPAVVLDGPSGHVQGSVVAAAVNTGIEFRNAPFAC